MSTALLTVRLHNEHDVGIARRRARQVAGLLGMSVQDQARVATGVSEIARNAFEYAGGGKVEYLLQGPPRTQELVVRVSDQGPGIADLATILAGGYRSRTGLGIGITGTRSLMDTFTVDTRPGEGTTVVFGKRLGGQAADVGAARLREVSAELSRIRPDDVVGEVQAHAQDLLRTMEALRLREEESARLYAREQEATRARDMILAIVSHDLRSPLNAIFMGASFLLDVGPGEVEPAVLEKQLQVIQRSARQANRMIEDLLDVTCIEAGALSVATAPEAVAALLDEVAETFRFQAEAKSIGMALHVPADLPAVDVDRHRILQAIGNLLGNALKFTPPEGSVTLGADLRGERVRLWVRDTGPGISAEQLPHVFDRFWQAGDADRRGIGLGLAIAQGIVEAHGGVLAVESRLGEGSTFCMTVRPA